MRTTTCAMVGLTMVYATGLYAASGDDLRLFDFGTSKSALMAGFEPVTRKTAYAAEQGYGWQETQGLRELEAGGKKQPGAPDALMGDYIHSNGRDFIIDLPAGAYRVVAYVDGYQLHGRVRFQGYRIKANGKEVARLDWTHKQFLTEEYFFKDWDRDFDPADCVWARWVEDLHRTEVFDVAPVKGQVRLTFSSGMQIFGLIVYPAAKEDAARQAIRQVDEHRKQEFYSTFFAREIPEPEPLPPLTPAERERGYLVYARHIFEGIGYNSAPKREEINRPLAMFAARGEYETVTFTVLPLAGPAELAVTVGDLRANGAVIPASALKLDYLRYRWQPGGAGVKPRGMILVPGTAVKTAAGVNRRFYLTVRVPDDAKPGVYRGAVRIAAAGRPPTDLPVQLRVLPLTLPRITETGLSAGYYYYSPRGTFCYDRMNNEKDPEAERWLERDLRLMQAFNLNGFQADSRGTYTILDYDKLAAGDPAAVDFSLLDRDLAVCRRVGFDGVGMIFVQNVHNAMLKQNMKLGSEAYGARVRNFFKLFGNHVREQGGPELLAWLTDEVRETGLNSWNLNHDDTLRYCQLLRNGGGNAIRTTLTLMGDRGGSKDYTDLVPACDVTQTHFWDKSEKLIETANEGGHELWSYNSGSSRYSWGLQIYRLNGKGRWQWHYYTHVDRPYNPVTGSFYQKVYYTPSGHFVSPDLVEAREGLDDYRYIWLLEQAVKKGGSAAARANGEKALADVRSLPPYGIKLAGGAEIGGAAKAILPSQEDYDRLRWRIAQALERMKNE
ncbi:MAG: hypothetical protein JXR37_34275 [Kiritimatiellae bacterium]|nr:hypothetical protein [Kiritimatiellia bacterium]